MSSWHSRRQFTSDCPFSRSPLRSSPTRQCACDLTSVLTKRELYNHMNKVHPPSTPVSADITICSAREMSFECLWVCHRLMLRAPVLLWASCRRFADEPSAEREPKTFINRTHRGCRRCSGVPRCTIKLVMHCNSFSVKCHSFINQCNHYVIADYLIVMISACFGLKLSFLFFYSLFTRILKRVTFVASHHRSQFSCL